MLDHLLIDAQIMRVLESFLEHIDDRRLSETLVAHIHQLRESDRISFEQWWELLETLQKELAIPALGLRIGEYIRVEHLGCLGYLLKTSQHIEQALKSFERFQRLLYEGNQAQLVFREDPGLGPIGILHWSSEYGLSSQLSDELLLSGLMTITRTLLGDGTREALSPCYVHFTNHIPNGPHSLYEHYFGCPVHFGQDNLEIAFPATYFSRSIADADANLHAIINSQATVQLESTPQNSSGQAFLDDVRKALIRALQEGKPSAHHVARQLNLSTRTLHRRLAESGWLFRDILRNTRMLLAKKYLREARLSLAEIALMLGYAEQSAFNRAFRQWFNCSPKQFRLEFRS